MIRFKKQKPVLPDCWQCGHIYTSIEDYTRHNQQHKQGKVPYGGGLMW